MLTSSAVFNFARRLADSPMDLDRGDLALMDALQELSSTESELLAASDRVARVAADVRHNLERGMNLNSLGVLQSLGAELDRLTVLRQERINSVLRLASALDRPERLELVRSLLQNPEEFEN